MSLTDQRVAPLLGIVLMVASGLFMNLNNAILKWLSADFPVGEIMFMRAVAILPAIGLFAVWRGGWAAFRINRPSIHLVRIVVNGTSGYFFILSVHFLPLATAVAITFAAPLFITAFAAIFLNERVGWRRWGAVAVGFIGILVITRPGSALFQLVVVFPLICAIASASRDVITRRMTAGESSVAIMLTTNLGSMAIGLATVPFTDWAMPERNDILIVMLCGAIVGVGHFTLIEAYRHAEAAIAAPFRYTAIIWAGLLGYIVWGDLPDGWAIAGTIIVIVSGIYIARREYITRRQR